MPGSSPAAAPRAPRKNTLPIFIDALKLAEQVAGLAPLPYLKNVLSATVHLMETIQTTRDNQNDCLELAKTAADLALTIDEATKDSRIDGKWNTKQLEDLVATLKEIDGALTERSRRPWLKRALTQSVLKVDIPKYRQRLDDFARSFGIVSHIDVKYHLSRLEESHSSILQEISVVQRHLAISHPVTDPDDGFHHFKRCDLELGRELTVPNLYRRGNIRSHEVHVQGKLYVAKIYHHKDRYMKDLELLKNVWHGNIEQLIGYSSSNSKDLFIVSRSGTRGVDEIFQQVASMPVIERFEYTTKLMHDLYSACIYLRHIGWAWTGGWDDLTTDENGKLYLENRSGDALHPVEEGALFFEQVLNPLTLALGDRESSGVPMSGMIEFLHEEYGSLSRKLSRASRPKYSPNKVISAWAEIRSEDWVAYKCHRADAAPRLGDIGVYDDENESFRTLGRLNPGFEPDDGYPEDETVWAGEGDCAIERIDRFDYNSEGEDWIFRSPPYTRHFWGNKKLPYISKLVPQRALEIAREHQVPPRQLLVVTRVSQYLEARRLSSPSADMDPCALPTKPKPPLYFFRYPLNADGTVRKPWGHFSEDPNEYTPHSPDAEVSSESGYRYTQTVKGEGGYTTITRTPEMWLDVARPISADDPNFHKEPDRLNDESPQGFIEEVDA